MTGIAARPTPRFTLTKEKNGRLRIVLPPQHDVEVGLCYGVALILWGLLATWGTRQLLFGRPWQSPEAFVLAWLIGSILAGGFMLFAFLWNAAGQEVVTLDGETLTLRRSVGRLGRSRTYRRGKMRDLRAAPQVAFNPFNGFKANAQAFGVANGCVAFEYEYATHHFGAGIDEEEAKHLLAVIRQHGGSFGDAAGEAV